MTRKTFNTTIISAVLMLIVLKLLPGGLSSLKVNAAATPIAPQQISRPSEIETYKNRDIGIVFERTETSYPHTENVYSFTIAERGWVVFDSKNVNTFDYNKLYSNMSLTAQIDYIKWKTS